MRRDGWHFPEAESPSMRRFFFDVVHNTRTEDWRLTANDGLNFNLKHQRLLKQCPVPPGDQSGEIL